MSDVKQMSIEDYLGEDNIRYENVEVAPGQFIKLGSVSSADILDWFEEREDKIRQKRAGLYLLVKSIINPDGSRVPKAAWDVMVDKLAVKDAKINGMLVKQALALNGLKGVPRAEAKNDSSETPAVVSPSDSRVN